MGKFSKENKQRNFVNDQIRANKIILIGEDWEKIWMFSRKNALEKWEKEWKDVIQIWFNFKENIATAKFMELGKFYYQQKKEKKERKNSQKSKWIKEVKISYNIGENDLNMKIERARKFLEDKYWVKFVVRLKWRERIYKNRVRERMKTIEETLSDVWKSQGVKEEGSWFSIILFAKVK